MQIITKNSLGYCALLDKPDDFPIYAAINTACHLDKLNNPGVDDDYAAGVIKHVRAEGDAYWRPRFEDEDMNAFVVFTKEGEDVRSVAFSAVVLPTPDNKVKAPVLCSAHVLHDYRGYDFAQLLVEASVKFIAERTHYKEAHVVAKKDNEPSIAVIKKSGFFLLKSGDRNNIYMGRIPMLMQRRRCVVCCPKI